MSVIEWLLEWRDFCWTKNVLLLGEEKIRSPTSVLQNFGVVTNLRSCSLWMIELREQHNFATIIDR